MVIVLGVGGIADDAVVPLNRVIGNGRWTVLYSDLERDVVIDAVFRVV